MRDGYSRTDPMFTGWRQGQRFDPADWDSWWRPWLDIVVAARSRGVIIRRARIVSEPVSEYIRWEYDITFTNVEAGEDVRWLPRRRASDLLLPGNDFWVFDDRVVLWNHFTGEGEVSPEGWEMTGGSGPGQGMCGRVRVGVGPGGAARRLPPCLTKPRCKTALWSPRLRCSRPGSRSLTACGRSGSTLD